MISTKWKSLSNFFLVTFLVFLIILIFFPYQTDEFGLKKPLEPKPKKSFPYHKITRIAQPEDEELDEDIKEFFEKVHHADVKTIKTPVQDDDEEEEQDIEEAKRKLSSGIFGWLFGSNKKDEPSEPQSEPVTEEETPAPVQKEETSNRNGIINWLQSLKGSDSNQQAQQPVDNILIEYFNRWPFNAIFPIGKPEKIVVPTRNRAGAGSWIPGEPISDDDFESLLAVFPNFVANPNYVNDIDCKQQLQILQRQLRGHKMWTLQMLDATGKIPSGILRGNINQFGDFDMCTQIKTVVKVTQEVAVRIKGKYCLAHVEIQSANAELKVPVHLSHGRGLWNSHLNDPLHFAPRYSIVNWGICIPHACPSIVVRDMIDHSLRPYNHTGIYFHAEVNENDCYIRNSTRFRYLMKQNGNIGFTIGYFILFLSAVISAILIENRTVLKVLSDKIGIYVGPQIAKFKEKFKDLIKKSKPEENSKTENENPSEEQTIPEENNQTEENEKVETESAEEVEPNSEENVEVVSEEEQTEPSEQPKSLFKDIILSFSPKRSIIELLSPDKPDTQFAIFHVFKIFCTFMLYLCLKFLMLGHLPVLNRDKLIKSLDTPVSILFRSPLIYFDILLIISGFIKSHQMCQEMEEKYHIYVLKRMTSKILRFLPTLYAVLFFQTWILPYLGSGPLWNNLIGLQSQICAESMWRNLFGVQNAINFEETCSPMTIQHSVELQLYLLAPLVVWLFYCNSDVGFMVYGGIHAMSVAARYSRTNIEHLSSTIFHGIHISKFYRTANLLFSSPIPRATAFLIGIGAGILHKTSGNEWRDMSKIGLISGWLTAAASIFYCFWYPSSGVHLDYVYNSGQAASYASWSPLLLGLAMSWIIFMVPTRTVEDEPTPLHHILTSRPILFLSRITYPTQLVSYVVVLYFTAEQKEPNRYSIADLINFGEIAIIIFYASVLSIIIDIPMQNVMKILINKILPDKPPSIMESEEVIEGGEHEADEKEEGDSEIHVSVDKEEVITDNIWGADPEEEEKKYLARRRSSLLALNGDSSTEDNKESTTETTDANSTEGQEEEIEEEETEITEDEEIVKRPVTPENPTTPPPTTQRRRRLND